MAVAEDPKPGETGAAKAPGVGHGKVCLITGASAGLGKVAAYRLAAEGFHLFLACRNAAKTDPVPLIHWCQGGSAFPCPPQIIEDIRRTTGNEKVEFLPLDLASLASVRACAEQFLQRNLPLHLLINNAGTADVGLTQDGFEFQFGVNHLGHFLLTRLLLDCIRRSAPARIIVVTSEMHRLALGIPFSAIRKPRWRWVGFGGYAVSKLANILMMQSLTERLKDVPVVVHSVHPGGVWTDIYHDLPWIVQRVIKFGTVSPEEGVATILNPALLPQYATTTGLYFNQLVETRPTQYAQDRELAERVWKASEEWVGLASESGTVLPPSDALESR